jgi:hypothetical protein
MRESLHSAQLRDFINETTIYMYGESAYVKKRFPKAGSTIIGLVFSLITCDFVIDLGLVNDYNFILIRERKSIAVVFIKLKETILGSHHSSPTSTT